MLLILDDEHKEHLSFLTEVDVAEKMSVSVDTIQHGVQGLMYLLTECAKLMVSELDFQDSIMVLGFSEELKTELLQVYMENRKEIRRLLSGMAMGLPQYHNLEWRLDVQVASRSLRHHIQPSVILRLHTDDDGEKKARVLQTDPVNLLHMASVLESALNEMKGQHVRRIMRNIK